MTPASHFPALHRTHQQGWINDPNGILHHEGRWHVYFQHNPRSARHEHILWGHMSSADLVRWQAEPDGPTPRPGEADQGGCWSGVGYVDADASGAAVPTLIYSAVDGTEDQLARVAVARTDAQARRLEVPGVVAAEVPEQLDLIGIRDPFLVEVEGRRWAIQGAGVREGDRAVPVIALFDATDLERWRYAGVLLRGDHPVAAEHAPAELWECPQLVQVDGTWVLMLSLWMRPEVRQPSTVQVNYLAGELSAAPGEPPQFVPHTGGRVDVGPDFYAPQAVRDDVGDRVLMWGWSWEGAQRTQQQTDDQGWAGTLTFPRELRVVDGALSSCAPRELEGLRRHELALSGEQHRGLEPLVLPAPFRAEVLVEGPGVVRLLRADGGAEEIAVLEQAVRLQIDGGILEALPPTGPTSTTRLYPAAEDKVQILAPMQRAWELGIGG